MAKFHFTIAVLPGDGIGVDVTTEAVKVLRAVEKRFHSALGLTLTEYPCGAICYQQTGFDLPETTLNACRTADAVLLGAMGHPEIRKPDGTELTPQVTLRVALDLYAGVRPCRFYPGAKSPLAGTRDIDFVILREQTEGLFASQTGGILLRDQVATDTLVMTRSGIERIAHFAFQLSHNRPRRTLPGLRKVTSVDKANIFKSYAFFRKIFDEVAAQHPDIASEKTYIDAQALYLVQRPETFDVIVTENMFGDILSDLGAGLIGGMGMAPSADLGDRHGVFQPAHGTAPDIAGKGIANPIAAILSAGMMLHWLNEKSPQADLRAPALAIEAAVAKVLAEGKIVPVDQGGKATTAEIGDAITRAIGA